MASPRAGRRWPPRRHRPPGPRGTRGRASRARRARAGQPGGGRRAHPLRAGRGRCAAAPPRRPGGASGSPTAAARRRRERRAARRALAVGRPRRRRPLPSHAGARRAPRRPRRAAAGRRRRPGGGAAARTKVAPACHLRRAPPVSETSATANRRRFRQVDVFAEDRYLGNPLAVVLDADGLSTPEMERVARWTNLSETTFVLAARAAEADYRVRIFTATPAHRAMASGSRYELPFAGHPTLGTCHAWLEAGGTPPRDGLVRPEWGARPGPVPPPRPRPAPAARP